MDLISPTTAAAALNLANPILPTPTMQQLHSGPTPAGHGHGVLGGAGGGDITNLGGLGGASSIHLTPGNFLGSLPLPACLEHCNASSSSTTTQTTLLNAGITSSSGLGGNSIDPKSLTCSSANANSLTTFLESCVRRSICVDAAEIEARVWLSDISTLLQLPPAKCEECALLGAENARKGLQIGAGRFPPDCGIQDVVEVTKVMWVTTTPTTGAGACSSTSYAGRKEGQDGDEGVGLFVNSEGNTQKKIGGTAVVALVLAVAGLVVSGL